MGSVCALHWCWVILRQCQNVEEWRKSPAISCFLNGWWKVTISMEDNNKDGKTDWIVTFLIFLSYEDYRKLSIWWLNSDLCAVQRKQRTQILFSDANVRLDQILWNNSILRFNQSKEVDEIVSERLISSMELLLMVLYLPRNK